MGSSSWERLVLGFLDLIFVLGRVVCVIWFLVQFLMGLFEVCDELLKFFCFQIETIRKVGACEEYLVDFEGRIESGWFRSDRVLNVLDGVSNVLFPRIEMRKCVGDSALDCGLEKVLKTCGIGESGSENKVKSRKKVKFGAVEMKSE